MREERLPVDDLSFPDLRAFLDQLRRDGDLAVVEAQVDARLEAAEIHRRVIAAGGPRAPLHERARRRLPAGHEPLRHRAAGRAGVRPPAAAGSSGGSSHLAETLLPPTAGEALGRPRPRPRGAAVGLARRRRGPVTEVVTRDVRLDRLPALTCWPEDGGPFVTLPLVYTEHPDAPGGPNLGMYRLQVHDARTTGMHWQIGKGGGFHYAVAEARGESAAGHRLPRRPARADPGRDRAAARERARADARLAARRPSGSSAARAPARTRWSPSAEFALVGHVPRPGAPARGAVRRPLRLLLAAPRLPGLRRREALPPPRRHLPRHRRGQAAPGGLLHRGPPAGAARRRSSRW